MDAIPKTLKYENNVTSAYTPLSEPLDLGRGVCQDFAHLFLGTVRALGLPARYVSGYVEGPGELATHAWCQVWAGRHGWVDIDPTRETIVTDHHVVTALGRDYADVPPNRGVWRGRADETIAVTVKVEPLERMPAEWSDWGMHSPLARRGMDPEPVAAQRTPHEHSPAHRLSTAAAAAAAERLIGSTRLHSGVGSLG
jgi:transglutaminase-like putative cysteine protease